MDLSKIIPGLSTIKLIGYALAAAALIALVAFAFFTVKGWYDDAARLPTITAQRDQALSDYKALDSHLAGTINGWGGKLVELEGKYAAIGPLLSSNQQEIATDIDNFRRTFAHDAPQSPLCVEPQPVRDGLRALFPAKPVTQPGVGSSGSDHHADAGSPTATGRIAAMPGREQPASDRGEIRVPTAAGSAALAGDGQSARPGSGADRRAAAGDGPALPASKLGLWSRFKVSAARAAVRFAAAFALIGAGIIETADEDGRDA